MQQLLAEAVTRRVTLVSAPAGFGKTSLLQDFARTVDRPVCWYALEKRDGDAAPFFTYLLASIRQQFPWFGQKFQKRLSGKKGDLADGELMEAFAAEVYELKDPFVLVLDDVHVLDTACHAHSLLESWIQHLPENCHLVLGTRTAPEFAMWPLLAARQEISELSAKDLAFTLEECGLFLKESLGVSLSQEQVTELWEVSEGWAAPLVLMAAKADTSLTALRQERLKPADTLYQYLEAEVFGQLPEDLQSGLLRTAVALDLDPDFCRAVLDMPQWEEQILHRLESLNLVEHPAGQPWPRLRRLLRSFLVSKLRLENTAEFANLNRRAALMLEDRGDWNRAVYHLVHAQAWEQVVQVMDKAGPGLFEEGKWDVLADWLESVPEAEVQRYPSLVLWKAKILHYLNQMDQALQLLVGPVRSFEASQDWHSLAQGLVIRGMCLRVKGDYQAAKEALSYARSLLLEKDGSLMALTEARKELGVTYAQAGEFEPAMQELGSVLDIYEAQGDLYAIAEVNEHIAGCYLFLGKLPESVMRLERARQRWLRLGNDKRLVQTLNNIGFVHGLLGEYQKAEEAYEIALQILQTLPRARTEGVILNSLADCKRETGQLQAALALYERSLELSRSVDDGYTMVLDLNGIAETYRFLGDLASANASAGQAMAEAERQQSAHAMAVCQLTRGLIQRDSGQPQTAIAMLEAAVESLKRADARQDLVKAYFNLGAAYFSQKRKRAALECLDLAAILLKEMGYDGFLAAEAGRAPQLVQYAAANKVAEGYYSGLLKKLKTPAESSKDVVAESAPEGRFPLVQAYGLGNVRVLMAGREVTDLEWRSEKSKEMFFFLLASRHPLRKDEIVAALWPDAPEEKTGSHFHSTLYRLRQALYPECVIKEGGAYLLNPQAMISFDVEEFTTILKRAEPLPREGQERLLLLERALCLYEGPFAPAFYSEWVERIRWQLEEQHLRLLSGLAAVYGGRGDYTRAIDLCRQVLAVDELNQLAWRRLIKSYEAAGETEAAKFAARRYSELLEADEVMAGDDDDWGMS